MKAYKETKIEPAYPPGEKGEENHEGSGGFNKNSHMRHERFHAVRQIMPRPIAYRSQECIQVEKIMQRCTFTPGTTAFIGKIEK